MVRQMLPLYLAAVGLAGAQEIQFQGTVSGWVQDPPTQSIRLITGMPGAALLGPQLVSDLAWASTAPGGLTAIALRNGEAAEAVLLRADRTTSAVAGSPLASAPQFAAWTPDARTAVLLWAESRVAQIVHVDIAAGTASADASFPIANLPEGGAITAAAALGDAFYVAIAGSGIYRVAAGQDGMSAGLILSVADSTVLAAHPDGGKLWTVDRSSHTLIEFPADVSGGDSAVLSSDPDVLSAISALQISTDRKTLYLANAGSRRIYRFDLESRQISDNSAELDIAATMMIPLSRPATFLLGVRSSSTESLYVWDENSGSVFFIPNGGESN
jgi:hypothetical protein